MPTITTVDMAWQPAPATFTDAEARRFDTAMFLGDGSANGVRGGVVRHGDTSLAVSINGSDQVTVQAGAAVIPAATGLGVYRGALSAATSAVAIDARNATNPRIDLVVFRATGAVDIITGTPGVSPTAPAVPAQTIELGRLNIPAVSAGAAVVDSTWRAYACALGATLFVETSARLPGSGNQKGQRATALNTGVVYEWDGTRWARPSIDMGYAEITANYTSGAPTAVTDVPGLAVTVDATGQPLWVEYQIALQHTAAGGGYLQVFAREGSTQLTRSIQDKGDVRVLTLTGGARLPAPSAGSHTYKLSISTDLGASGIAVFADASTASWIRVRPA